MSLLSPQTLTVLSVGALTRKLNEVVPFSERILNGLRYYRAIPWESLDRLIKPVSDADTVSEDAHRKYIRDILETDSMKGTIRPANRQRYLSFLDRLPLDYSQFLGREAYNRVTLLSIFVMVSYTLISIFECSRSLLPGMVAVPMLVLLIISVLIGLASTLQENAYLKQQITEQSTRPSTTNSSSSTSSGTAKSTTVSSDVRTAIAAGTLMSLLAFIALFVIYNYSDINVPALMSVLPSTRISSGEDSEFDTTETNPVRETESIIVPPTEDTTISSTPFIDLGSSLRYGLIQAVARTSAAIGWISMADAQIPHEPAKTALFLWIVMIAIILGFTCTLLFDPAIRIARCYHDLTFVDPIEYARIQRTNKTLSWFVRAWNWTKELPRNTYCFLWFYGPLLLSMLWYPSLFSDRLVPKSLVRCSSTSLARDCWPDGTPFYNSQQNRTLSLASFISTVSPFDTKISSSVALPLTYGIQFSESGWLQVRIMLVLAYVLLHILSLRKFMALSLRNAREGQVDLVVAIAQQAPNRNTRVKQEKFETIENRSGYNEDKLRSFGEACQAYVAASIRNIMVYGLHLIAPVTLFGALSLLILRLGYLENGLGVCTACRFITQRSGGGWLIETLAQYGPPKADAIERLLELLSKGGSNSNTNDPFVGSGTTVTPVDTLRAGREALMILTSAFWRPVLSFSLWFLLVAVFIMQEMGFIFFRFLAPLARAERAKQSIDGINSATKDNNNNSKDNSRKQK